MIYIVCALFIEAKPLIKKYDLKKENSFQKFQIFSNEDMKLIISGVGKIKSAIAITYLFENFKVKESDFIINLGYCASTNYNDKLNEIVMISKIKSAYSNQAYYPDMLYKHDFIEGTTICYDKVVETYESEASKYENIYIDMESIGFFEAASMYLKKDKIIVLKLISDILRKRKEDRTIIDINNKIDLDKIYQKIYDFIENLKAFIVYDNNFSDLEEKYISKISNTLKLTDTMYYEFLNLLKYLKLSKQDIIVFLKKYETMEIKTKLEGKKQFEDIKKRIIEF